VALHRRSSSISEALNGEEWAFTRVNMPRRKALGNHRSLLLSVCGARTNSPTQLDRAAKKDRDADHLLNFVGAPLAGVDSDKLTVDLLKTAKEKIPDYAFDSHMLKGKRKGKTKADFFREEQCALKPFQPGLFDDLPER
jgi:hypothetical protein